MRRCCPKYRNISSRRRESSDRYAHLALVGSAAAQPPAPVAGSNCGRGQRHLCQCSFDQGTRDEARDGKLSFGRSIVDAVSEPGFEILPVTGSHAEHAGGCRVTITIHSIGCASSRLVPMTSLGSSAADPPILSYAGFS